MTMPLLCLRSIPQRHRVPLVLLACCLATGCQTAGFSSALSGKKADTQTASSTETAQADDAGLPQPTNTLASNSPLSLSSIDEHLRLGDEELARGNYQQAQTHFDHVLKKHPDHVKAHHRLGVLADKRGQYEQAEQHYLTALAGDSRNAALLSDLGYSYLMQGRHADAERYLLESRRVDPQYETAIANLGLLYGSSGRKQEALALFRQIGNDEQVQAIMQQIDGGEFGTVGRLADTAHTSQQSSVVTSQSSVQQSTGGSGTRQGRHLDPARDLADQLQQAREELRRAEEQLARHQQSQQTPDARMAHNTAQQTPQQSAWAQQGPPPQQGQMSRHNQPAPAQHTQPAAGPPTIEPLARTQNTGPTGMNNAPATLAPQNTAAPLPQVTPGPRNRVWQNENTPAQQQASTAGPSSSGGVQISMETAAASPSSAPPQSAWGQAAAQNSVVPAANAQTSPPPAAWGQQPAASFDPSGAQAATHAPQAIQQMSGSTHPAAPQQPVEHALHTQNPQHSQNIMLATGQGAAGSTPNGPLPQIGDQPPASQSMPAVGNPPAQSSQTSSFEAARREAALLGLGAGPGQVFPYVQRYERVRPSAGSQAGSGSHPAGPPQITPGATSSANAPAPSTQPFQQRYPQQATPQQSWQQQAASGTPSGTSPQPAAQSNGQSWGQQSSAPYGTNPTTTTQNYAPAATPAPQRSQVTPMPYYERPSAGHQGGAVQTGYQSPQPQSAGSYPPQQTSGGVVVPEAYPNRQPTPAAAYQHQMAPPSYYQQQSGPQHVQQPPAQPRPQPYTGPMIVPSGR